MIAVGQPVTAAKRSRFVRWGWGILGLAVLAWSWQGVGLSPRALLEGGWAVLVYLADYWPPTLQRLDVYAQQLVVTLQMAVWGTVLAVLSGMPLSILAASNLSPHPVVHVSARRLLDLLRAVNEMVFALIFVVAVGLGPFAGVLAMAAHTAGVFGKLMADALESIDPGPVEAARAAGAGGLQVFSFAVWPQVLPHFASYTLLRFETNIRAATIVGFTGAGGIGFYLWDAIRSFDSHAVATILALILVLVAGTDAMASRIRKGIV